MRTDRCSSHLEGLPLHSDQTPLWPDTHPLWPDTHPFLRNELRKETPCGQNKWHTPVKTVPSPILRMRSVITQHIERTDR